MMLKRQESSLSSSRRLAAAATPPLQETRHAKPIGCMSGIFQLFSKYQNSSKRLTFGRKREKCKPSSPAKDKDKPKKDSLSSGREYKSGSQDFGLSLEINVPRSPSIPPEIRLSNAVKSPENPRTPSSVVARLMGLGDMNASVKRPALEETGTISEKRRQLIRALEKCNDDLEGLRRIIQAVQTNDMRLQPPSQEAAAAKRELPGRENEDSWVVNSCTEKRADVGAEARAPTSGFPEAQNTVFPTPKTPACLLPHRKPPTSSKKPGEDDAELMAVFFTRPPRRRSPPVATSPRLSTGSSPKARTLEEVCKDVAWGEQREMGRILVVLQDCICRDLVEEVVKELKSCRIHYSLPLDGCKRRLSF